MSNYRRISNISRKELNGIDAIIYYFKTVEDSKQENVDEAIKNIKIAIKINPTDEQYKIRSIKFHVKK